MKVKKIISAFILIFAAFSIYGDTTLINVSPYSSGSLNIYCDMNSHDPIYNQWYKDTIYFSSGTKITFMELNQMFITYIRCGGLIFIDTLSSVYYKCNDSLENGGCWNPSEFTQGMFKQTINNPDTNWDEAMHFPDSLAPCDTFVFETNINNDTLDTLLFAKSKCIYYSRSESAMCEVTFPMENYKGIFYVKCLSGIHMKMQIYDFIIDSNPMGEYPDTIKLLWAADSCGNGIFKHDPTSKKTINQTKSKTDRIFISKQNGRPYLYVSNSFNTGKEIKVEIYNSKGRRILTTSISSLKPVSLSRLHSGVYLAHISVGREKYIRNFVLTE